MGGGHCVSPGRLPGGDGWSELGLEAFPAGRGQLGISPVPLTPVDITSSRRGPCVWPRPRPVTAVSTNAQPVTPRGLPLGTTFLGYKVGPKLWLLSYLLCCPSVFLSALPSLHMPTLSPLHGFSTSSITPTSCLPQAGSPSPPFLPLSYTPCLGPQDTSVAP